MTNSYQEQQLDFIEEHETFEKRITELEAFVDKVINWEEQFSLTQRIDIGSLGQQRHFQDLARKVLNSNECFR